MKAAGSVYKGLCPFHAEKTPSFIVTPARQRYHCFGCGTGGDVISFVMEAEGVTFPEAVEILARPLDIDVVWLYGYGFPVYLGGPMFYADTIGLGKVYDAVLKYRDLVGAEYWTPAPLLEKLAKEGKGFYSK